MPELETDAFSWEFEDDGNLYRLNDGGAVSKFDNRFIVSPKATPEIIVEAVKDLLTEIHSSLVALFQRNASELADWHPSAKYKTDPGLYGGPKNCIGVKSYGNKLAWLRQSPVVEALMALGHVPEFTPSGRRRSIVAKGLGSISDVLISLPLPDQKATIAAAFDLAETLDDILNLSQSNLLDLELVFDMLRNAKTVDEAMDYLVGQTNTFFVSKAEHEPGKYSGRGGGRSFGGPWALMMLARKGLVIWPKLPDDADNLIPRLLRPLWWEIFTAEPCRTVSRSIQTMKEGGLHRVLLLNTTLFHGNTVQVDLLKLVKTHFNGENDVAKQHQINIAVRKILKHHGLTYEDIGAAAAYFGGRARLGSGTSIPMIWAEMPQASRLERFREVVGEPPEKFEQHIVDWANELRSLIKHFGTQTTRQTRRAFDLWLMFIASMGDAAPRTWLEIAPHQIHGTEDCFVNFVKENLNRSEWRKCLASMETAWFIASGAHNFPKDALCPFRPADLPSTTATSTHPHRTNKKAIFGDLVPLLVARNRADDFAFARSLGRFDRHVVDQTTGDEVVQFWPAIPIILDMLFQTGMRQASAFWSDSGEGDSSIVEFRAESGTDAIIAVQEPNPNPAARHQRSSGFVQIEEIEPGRNVLRMHVATAKSGEFSFPYLDEELAQSVVRMRHWQERFNPRKGPVSASRDRVELEYGAKETIPLIFPVFRDPKSPMGHPPTEGTLSAYFSDLLAEVEPEYNRQLQQNNASASHVSLVTRGKPRWSLHSIRVTMITELLSEGVSPAFVQEFVGHKALQMTLYYDAASGSRAHTDIQQGTRRILLERAEKVGDALERGASDDEIREILGGYFNIRGTQDTALTSIFNFRDKAPLLTSHTLCPGIECGTGGEKAHGVHTPVFRPFACSLCRHRITGPAFLNGLVHRANCLMVEIKETINQERDVNTSASEAGRVGARLNRDALRKIRALRKDLLREYTAEYATIKRVTEKLAALPIVEFSEQQPSLSPVVIPTHEFALLDGVLSEAELIAGSQIEVPSYASNTFSMMTLSIAAANNISEVFLSLPPDHRDKSLRLFGRLLVQHVNDMKESNYKALSEILDGEVRISEVPALSPKVEHFLSGVTNQTLNDRGLGGPT